MGQLMPILKPAGYRANEPLFFRELIFKSSAAPVVAFGVDEGDTVMYQGATDDADYRVKLPAIKEEAFRNLAAIQTTLDIQPMGNTCIAFVMGSEYACEKILDKAFMKDLATRVGCESLMVGIPFKGTLIATDANGDQRLRFPVVVKKCYDDPQNDAISDKVFLVQDGEIVAFAGEEIKDDSTESFAIIENGKTNNYKVELKSTDIEAMTKDMNASFQQIILMLMDRKVFGGEIHYHVSSRMWPTEELFQKCMGYVKQIEANEIAQTLIHTATGSHARISFYYNNEKIAPLPPEDGNVKGN